MSTTMPKVNQKITKYNRTEKSSRKISYIVIHYVGATGGAEANCIYFARGYVGASAHYFVGHNGEVWQSVLDKDIAWHCGASSYKHKECRNDNSIGIELCVRTKGSQADTSRDWYFEDATVTAAAQLTKALMEKYNIPADHVLRHYDVTGKICPNPYVYNTTKHTWTEFKRLISVPVSETAAKTAASSKVKMTAIAGKAVATAAQMAAYIRKKNPKVPQKVIDMIPYYLSEGETEGIRGDLAFAQSCLETGNFTFTGSAVTLSQNNFCGMGVTRNGLKGNSFASPQLGIRAQIQHLKAYANKEKLVGKCVDPRFTYVTRGVSPYVDTLGIGDNPKGEGWAAGSGYGGKIITILGNIIGTAAAASSSSSPAATAKTETKKETSGLYLVTTTCDALRIRSGPGTRYAINGYIRETKGHKNKYTIVEVKGSWGKLKSGAGWISLNYTKKAS